MRYCRFEFGGRAEYGLVESVAGRDEITRLLVKPPEGAEDLEDLPTKAIPRTALAEAKLLVPVRPTKILCVGRNYREHAAELGNEVPQEPLIFFKPNSSLLAHGETIHRPKISERTDYEGELALIVGRRCHKIGPDEDVRPYILGYTALNDFTARDLQKKDGQWWRAKGFDTFCPVGPLVSTEVDPWTGVEVETRVNGEVRQHGNTKDFIFSLDVIMRHITQAMTLMPGDVIATGTPEGVGPVVNGDVVEIRVEGVGVLRNPIADE
ncbi:MAG: fumarylacetoacetate hydrolase family protein [Acidobacteriaceae bacterium]|nr:fumarylacetoacetate hydrolase family protein [Acidobacteriaceae bacterium]